MNPLSSSMRSWTLSVRSTWRCNWTYIRNYRGSAVALRITHAGHALFDGTVAPGGGTIPIFRFAAVMQCDLQGEVWTSDAELGNGDLCSISVHLAGVDFT